MAKSKGFPTYSAWETLVRMKFMNYNRLNLYFEQLSIKEGELENLDSAELSDYKQSLIQKNETDFIDLCRQATIMSSSYSADFHLRRLLIDYDPDTLIDNAAKDYFNEGEDYFAESEFDQAIKHYQKATELEPQYYKAVLYTGDAFMAKENYDSAIVYFTRAVEMQPTFLEARQLLIDALFEKELYIRAKKECIRAIQIYPGNTIKYRFQKVLRQENKYMEEHKIRRNFFANDMSDQSQPELLMPFATYRNAKNEISKYCNKDGIIEPNDMTKDLYLEVYSWRRFIEENEDDLPKYFRFALEMIHAGYFDCYVLISLFHVDIYPQFKHFMSIPENRTRAETYINTYLIERYQ